MTEDYHNNFIHEIIESDLACKKHASIYTRFPPEPNGYLHIGHAKSICLNFGIAEKFNGKCNLRFDDTNPEKENIDYINSIKEDVQWLGYKWDELHFASDYFEKLYQMAIFLIKKDLAYVDQQSSEEIKQNRGNLKTPGKNSPFRNQSIDENLALFEQMRAGKFTDGEVVLRAKIDMASPNIKLRDPIIYRVRHVHHVRTNDKWCIYPMYDFTHGQSDMLEKITHSLCTLEFEDHRPLYDWFLDQLATEQRPRQIEFSRLQLEYTVLSKRRLIQLVEQNYVDGWDDPRMPTIAGIRRRGIPPEAIQEFCHKIGITKKNAVIEINFFEGIVRDLLNTQSERRMAVVNPLKVTISNYSDSEILQIANHPQNESLGKRDVSFSNTIYIEKDDFRETANKKFKRLKLGEEVRLRGSYVIRCNDVIKNSDGEIIELICSYDPDTLGKNPNDGRKVKGVIHWVDAKTAVAATVINYDRLFSEKDPMAADNFIDVINQKSKQVIHHTYLEKSLADAPLGKVYQFERIGYYTKDINTNEITFLQTINLRSSNE